ncbi:hypothetical protein D3C74_221820 [compost metagenome]
MKKYLVASIIILLLIYIFIYSQKLELPFKGISPIEAITKVEKSDGILINLGTFDSKIWYISKSNHETTINELIMLYEKKGWSHDKNDGSGIFFQKNNNEKIITCRKWASRYLLCVDDI